MRNAIRVVSCDEWGCAGEVTRNKISKDQNDDGKERMDENCSCHYHARLYLCVRFILDEQTDLDAIYLSRRSDPLCAIGRPQ